MLGIARAKYIHTCVHKERENMYNMCIYRERKRERERERESERERERERVREREMYHHGGSRESGASHSLLPFR